MQGLKGTTAPRREVEARRGLITRFTGLLRDERGVAAPLMGLLIAALLGVAALAIDLGWLMVVRGELQNAADAGALAGVVDLVYNGEAAAETTATTYATRPTNYRLTDPIPAADAVTVTPIGPDTLQVRVRKAEGTAAGSVATIFARIWGIETMDVSAVAVATLEHRITGTGPGNLMPFGVRDTLVDQDGNGNYDIGNLIDIYPHDNTPGNFGLIDLNGGANSNSETIAWIEYGYDAFFIIPEDTSYINLEGDPGISGGSMNGAIASRVGDRVLFPVFDQVTGQGANTVYRVVDFVGGMIMSFQLVGAQQNRYLNVEITEFSTQNLTVSNNGGGPTNNAVSTPVLIQ